MLVKYLFSTLAIFVFLFVAFLISENKRKISIKLLLLGLTYQVLLTFAFCKWPFIAESFTTVSDILQSVTSSTTKATSFLFGGLSNPPKDLNLGYILVIQGFPVLIVISAISSVLTFWGVLPFIINLLSFVFQKTLKIGGALGVAVSANIFTGMSETPLVVTPYLKHLTRSELFSLMTCGTAAIASSVMVLLSLIMEPMMPNSIVHILSAVLISIPASLTISRIIVPETSTEITLGKDIDFSRAKSTLDALYIGIIDGGKVLITVVAMLIGFIALIDIVNQIFSYFTPSGMEPITIQRVLSWIMYPVAWLMDFPESDVHIAGSLIGTKIVLNEVIAFQELVNVADQISPKSKIMLIYALCNFANFSSIGIMIGVYGSLIPERRYEVIHLGLKSIIAGSLANIITATIIGTIYSL